MTGSSRGTRWAVAVLLSLGLHGLLLFGLCQAPAGQPPAPAEADVTQVPIEDDFALTLADAPPLPHMPPKPKPRDPGPVVQASFDVRMVNPPPTGPVSPPALPGAAGIGTAVGSSNSAGEQGAGDDRGPSALQVGSTARTVVYVVDRSVSMGLHGALARARREVLASIRRLPPTTRFQIIAYNREAEPLAVNGHAGLLTPDENTLRQVEESLAALRAAGGTDDGLALRRALAFHPDLLYFLTDADDLSPDDVRTVTRLNDRRTVIHTVELSAGMSRPNGPLHKLAADNGGAYQRLE